MIKFRYLLNYFFRIFILIICHILFLSNNYIYAGELSGTFSDLQTGDTGSSLIRDFPDSSPMSYQNVYVGKDANGVPDRRSLEKLGFDTGIFSVND